MLASLLSLQLLTALSTLAASAELNYTVCDAYTQLDATTPCGPKGYALNYGLPICRKFIDNEYLFNAKGKQFLQCVRVCLADYVTANITGKITDCTEIKNNAFTSHVPCYDKCNFCGTVLWNLPQFAVTFKISDFFSEIAIEQVAQVAVGCALHPIDVITGR